MEAFINRKAVRKALEKSSLLLVTVALMAVVLLPGCSSKKEEASPAASEAVEQTQEPEAESTDDDAQAAVEEKEEKEEKEEEKEAEQQESEEEKASKEEAPKLSPARLKEGEKIKGDIQKVADASGMTCCVTLVDLSDGLTVDCGGDTQLASASMIKMLIAYTFLEKVQAGKYSLDDLYTLKATDIVGGTGTLCGLGAGAQVSYREILSRMINVSDNTGTNILIDACSMKAINETAARLGLTKTTLNRYMMDTDAIAAGIENFTCANDMATLMQMVYEGTFVDEESSKVMLDALHQQQEYSGIAQGLPSDVSFAHKTGSLSTVEHDGGIVEGEHPFVLVVLCGGEGFWSQGAFNAMANVAQVAYADVTA